MLYDSLEDGKDLDILLNYIYKGEEEVSILENIFRGNDNEYELWLRKIMTFVNMNFSDSIYACNNSDEDSTVFDFIFGNFYIEDEERYDAYIEYLNELLNEEFDISDYKVHIFYSKKRYVSLTVKIDISDVDINDLDGSAQEYIKKYLMYFVKIMTKFKEDIQNDDFKNMINDDDDDVWYSYYPN